MYTFLIVITAIISVILIIMVLLQSSKGGGLAGTFGGAGMGTMFGTRRTADFLSKATWWLGGIVAILAIVINMFFLPGQTTSSERESIIQRSGTQNVPTSPSVPQQQPPQQQIPGNQN